MTENCTSKFKGNGESGSECDSVLLFLFASLVLSALIIDFTFAFVNRTNIERNNYKQHG